MHLRSAAAEGRILVTCNRDDSMRATRDAFAAGTPHAGVLILIRKLPRDPARVAHALARWDAGRPAATRGPMQAYEIAFLSS